jgi:hypothetical protein
MTECVTNGFSSRACEYGTKGCLVNHGEREKEFWRVADRIARQVESKPRRKLEGWAALDKRDNQKVNL